MMVYFFCFLFKFHLYCTRIVKIKHIIIIYKYLEDTKQSSTNVPSNLYRLPKPYMYVVNDSYMTVLGNPQDPVYVPTVLEVSGNSTPSYIHFFQISSLSRKNVRRGVMVLLRVLVLFLKVLVKKEVKRRVP